MSLTAVVFPHGLFFLTGQKGEEQGERERLLQTAQGSEVQLSFAVLEWASK